MLLENAGLASIYISNNANPSSFDGASITIGNSPSAYALIGMAMPSAITSNPYQVGSGLFTDYGMIWSSLTGDLTLGAPLQANYWRVYRDLDVSNGTTLTIEPGTLLKFEEAYDLRVLSGGTLNVNGTSGNEVVMTSFTDTNVGVANASLINDWEGVRFDVGSAGTVNYLTTWYGRDGVYITNSSPTFNNLTVNYSGDGVRINSTTNTSPVFNTMAINECSSTHLYLEGAGTLNPTFSGNLTITDISGSNATWGIYTTSADTTTISGFTITGSNRGVEIAGSTGANRIENNIITRAANYGIYHTADGNPWIRNNIITNNGSNTGSNTGGGIWVNGGNGIIFGNLIRDNRNYSGGGIRINNSSISLENNLIIENRSTSNTSNAGGSGVYVTGNGTSTINNNTIAFNTSADSANEGAGITFEMSANVTLTDNIIYGNTDGNSAAHDVYYESGTLTNNNNLIGTIIGGGSNLFSADASDIVGADPLFTDGWYLSTLTDQGTDSPAIDAGSVFATAVTPFPLDSLTTQSGPLSTDNDGSGSDGPDVNLGYHYASSAPVVNAANTLVTASPDSSVTPVNGSVSILITVTPRNGSSVVIGAGLDVVASAGSPLRLGTVVDRGDGTYQVTYLTPAAATGSDTVSFTVNGESIDTNININWIP